MNKKESYQAKHLCFLSKINGQTGFEVSNLSRLSLLHIKQTQ